MRSASGPKNNDEENIFIECSCLTSKKQALFEFAAIETATGPDRVLVNTGGSALRPQVVHEPFRSPVGKPYQSSTSGSESTIISEQLSTTGTRSLSSELQSTKN